MVESGAVRGSRLFNKLSALSTRRLLKFVALESVRATAAPLQAPSERYGRSSRYRR
jgi:hypothetical protein